MVLSSFVVTQQTSRLLHFNTHFYPTSLWYHWKNCFGYVFPHTRTWNQRGTANMLDQLFVSVFLHCLRWFDFLQIWARSHLPLLYHLYIRHQRSRLNIFSRFKHLLEMPRAATNLTHTLSKSEEDQWILWGAHPPVQQPFTLESWWNLAPSPHPHTCWAHYYSSTTEQKICFLPWNLDLPLHIEHSHTRIEWKFMLLMTVYSKNNAIEHLMRDPQWKKGKHYTILSSIVSVAMCLSRTTWER